MGNDLGLTLALPIAAATLATLLNDAIPLSIGGVIVVSIIAIGAIAAAVIAAGLSQLLSGASFTILGTGFTLPQMTSWFIRFLFVSTFLTTYYLANILVSMDIILSLPLGLGIILVGILTALFIFGIFSISSGGSGEE